MRHEFVVGSVAVVADVTDGATAADLRQAVAAAFGVSGGPDTVLYVDGLVVAEATPVARLGALTGREVLVAAPQPGWDVDWQPLDPDAVTPVTDGCHLAVVGGLHAGASVQIGAESVSVGRRPGSGLVLADGEVSRDHAELALGTDGVEVTDAGSRNGLRWRGFRLPTRAGVPVGDCIGLGETVVSVREPDPSVADLSEDPATGTKSFNRPPRLREPFRRPELIVPVPPPARSRFRFPWVAALAPLLMGAVMFVVMPQYAVYLVAMMALSPLMIVANLISDRRGGRQDHARAVREFDAARAQHEQRLDECVRTDEHRSRRLYPDPADIAWRAGLPGQLPAASLWQRRSGDGDFLRLRVGLHDRPADLGLRRDPHAPNRDNTTEDLPAPVAHDVPLTVDLTTCGVVGLAASRPTALAAARALICQLATLHAPGDVALALVTGTDTAADWSWFGWLPHTRPGSSAFAGERLIATDGTQAEARITELTRLVEERTATRRRSLADGPGHERSIVVVLDGARRLRDLPGLGALLREGPACGVYAICLDAEQTALPDECGATVVVAPTATTRATVRRPDAVDDDVLVDGMPVDIADAVARALAPLRVLGQTEADGGLPETVRFTDLSGLDPTPEAVLAQWSATPGARSSQALLGVGPQGPVTVDLVADGPHALIAGTSGAGKSELLQTLVASLAAVNAPDAMTFVLVDYKGGSAFAACADLPHCVGLVTDLDGHLVQRALDSLSAELRRREGLFAAAGAKDIDDYWARTGDRLPRLVIVVDEFASLVEEVPDFVPGVVGIGMRGRSLGVHVVLATQRPGGVVTADLRANVNLRISLRVTSEAESLDVIDDPSAARIPPRQPGRGFLRAGHSELTPVQMARVGWPLPAAGREVDVYTPPVVLGPRRLDALGRPAPRAAAVGADEHGRTDLTDLVTAIRAAADQAGVRAPARPWLPPLPELVPLAAVDASTSTGTAILGVIDRPDAQAQDPFVLDLERTGPLAVAGAVRAGRSTALRTVAGALAEANSPADVHLYALDCGNAALGALTELPHTGAVVDGADAARTTRLLALLQDEVTRRQRVLAAGGYGGLAEQRAGAAPEQRLAQVVLLLDRLESYLARYTDVDGGALIDRLEQLLRTGPAVGVTAVLSTDRTGFTHRIASAVAARLVLRQAGPDDAAAFGLDARRLPAHPPAGRGVWTPTGEVVQIGLLSADPSGAAQTEALRRLGRAAARRADGLPGDRLPRRVDPLPEQITVAGVEALRAGPAPSGSGVVTWGAGGDHLAPVDVDLRADGGCFVVAGPGRSGRSAALVTAVESLTGRPGALPVVIVAPRPSPLRELAGRPGVVEVMTGAEDGFAPGLADAVDRAGGEIVLVVDDAELITQPSAAAALESFVRDVRDGGSVLIAAATTEDLMLNRYRGWLAAARRDRAGLLLDPASAADGEIFDLRLPRSTGGGWPPGRALLARRGAVSTVQLARPASVLTGSLQ